MRPARIALVVSVACFALLALAVAGFDTTAVEAPARGALLALASPPVLAAMHAVNYAGSWRVLLPLTLLLLVAVRRARERWWLWVGLMIVAPATEGALKIVVGRPRPEDASVGFPSGHATAAAAFFGAVCYFAGDLAPPARRLVRAASVVVIALVAVARVMLRAHWPSDAAAGICLGAAFASAAALLDRRRES